MTFNSYLFILFFFPIAVVGYHMLNNRDHFKEGKWFLLAVSMIFYGFAGIEGFIAAVISALLNYGVYYLLHRYSREKLFLTLGIVMDVLALFVFKYLVTTEIKLNQFLGTSFKFNKIIVPLGISFITFSQITFLVDSYREKISKGDEGSLAKVSILDYLFYVFFFPKVTVGPIAFSKDFIPQINDTLRKKTNWSNISRGFYAFVFGLSKKVLIADVMAKYADWGFSNIQGLGSINALVVMLAYAMQIYFDFSGFCDMAMGIATIFNFDLPLNFNTPYRALSIGEFWDRWHITLTKFFTNYIYIPLGGSRRGKIRTYTNILIIFLISGIWHGAAFTFVIWGLLHGIATCIDKGCRAFFEKLPKIVRWFITFLFVNLAWVFFRANTLVDAIDFFKELLSFNFTGIDPALVVASMPKEYELIQLMFSQCGLNIYYTGLPVTVLLLLFAVFASIKMKNTSERVADFKPSVKESVITALLLVWSIISLSEVSSFIYVNF